jgi:tetratricopeptide (TPR) repeat protein
MTSRKRLILGIVGIWCLYLTVSSIIQGWRLQQYIRHQQTGHELLATHRYAAAIPELQAAVQAKPERTLVRLDLADALFGAGRWQEAIVQYRQAHVHSGYANTYLNLGIALSKTGQQAKAQAAWKTAIDKDGKEGYWGRQAVTLSRQQQ